MERNNYKSVWNSLAESRNGAHFYVCGYNDDEKLHSSLREFYNREESYFEEAGEANAELTPERRELFARIPDGALVVETPYGQQRVIAGEVRVLG